MRQRLVGCIISWFGLLFPAAFPAHSQEGPTRRDLEVILAAARKKHDVPALAACVVRSKGMQEAAVIGVRKRGVDVPATLTDSWHLGSDTKPMTAYLIALLIEMGLLNWDTPLDEVFPETAKAWPNGMRKITITQLLCHRSGLPGNWSPSWWVFENKSPTARGRRAALVAALGNVKLESIPGTTYLYSNLGYTLLGAIAERRGKASYEELMARSVFGPLNMKKVGWGPVGKGKGLEFPWPHDGTGKPVGPDQTRDNPSVMNSAGRAHAPLEDWARFCAEVLRAARGNRSLVKAATRDRMFSMPFKKGQFFCPAGWTGQPRNAAGKGLFLGHDGSNTMNYCTAALFPERDLAVLVACNQGGDAGRDACWAARDGLVKRMLR